LSTRFPNLLNNTPVLAATSFAEVRRFLLPLLAHSVIVGPKAQEESHREEMPSARLEGEKLIAKELASLSSQFAASANDRFEFQKSGKLFIRTQSESLTKRGIDLISDVIT
jgi:hypothetical protein